MPPMAALKSMQNPRASSPASRLLQWIVLFTFTCLSPNPCRSRLAGDGGLEIDAKPTGLIAGKPAPTVECVVHIFVSVTEPL